MNVGPFPVEDVIERLDARVPLARIVGTSADLASAVDTPPNASPALYVLSSERGGAIKYSGPVTQQNADVALTIVILVRNVAGEKRGLGARKLARQVIAQVRAALIGWTPDDAFNGISFSAGRDDRYRAGWLALQEIYRTDYRIANQVTL